MICRRTVLGLLAQLLACPVYALTSISPAAPDGQVQLSAAQARAFRDWFTLIVLQQFRLGPTPRWQQRDCAGLVRFAVGEALRAHDTRWLKANSFWGRKTPPEVRPEAGLWLADSPWRRSDGARSAWVGALELIQANTRWLGKSTQLAEPADLFFFDHGDAQHVMIWMGQYLAYHTGSSSATDNGLRAYPLERLMRWPDARWQAREDNPNFSGIYRLLFL